MVAAPQEPQCTASCAELPGAPLAVFTMVLGSGLNYAHPTQESLKGPYGYLMAAAAVGLSLQKVSPSLPRYAMVPDSQPLASQEVLLLMGAGLVPCSSPTMHPPKNRVATGSLSPKAGWMEKFITVRLLSFTQFERVLFMDGDTLALQRVDDVSRLSPMRLDQFAAAPQANVYGKSWSTWTGFNTGLLLLRPDEQEYSKFLNAFVSPPPKRAREELAAGRTLPTMIGASQANGWRYMGEGDLFNLMYPTANETARLFFKDNACLQQQGDLGVWSWHRVTWNSCGGLRSMSTMHMTLYKSWKGNCTQVCTRAKSAAIRASCKVWLRTWAEMAISSRLPPDEWRGVCAHHRVPPRRAFEAVKLAYGFLEPHFQPCK